MECFDKKDLNPETCKFSIKCKPGFERNDKFKCVKSGKTQKNNSNKAKANPSKKNGQSAVTVKKRKESTKKMSQLLDDIAEKIITESSKPGLILRSLRSVKNKLLDSNGLNERYSEIVDLFKSTFNKNTKSIELKPQSIHSIQHNSINKISEILANSSKNSVGSLTENDEHKISAYLDGLGKDILTYSMRDLKEMIKRDTNLNTDNLKDLIKRIAYEKAQVYLKKSRKSSTSKRKMTIRNAKNSISNELNELNELI